ncbi:MAG: class I SAM-dependent methyltransferase, partial [Acidobacteriaceae bacterium]
LYRAMEYLSFGTMLERCRFHHIPAVALSRRVLVLGDGDGRFLARLLAASPNLHADAVDASPAMLRLLSTRTARLGARSRLRTTCADARTFQLRSRYDLVCTHFFLDCLTASEADSLIARIRPHLTPAAQWLVSEFQIPSGHPHYARLARGMISALYAAFRLLTGLTVRQIPPWPALLARNGFRRRASRSWLGGLLVSEVWELPPMIARRPDPCDAP